MDKTPWYKKAEMLIGVSALVVSLVALIVGVYSAYLDRAFARASVWPKVEVHSIYSSTQKKLVYRVTNVGTGPALIEHAIVKYKSKVVKDWDELSLLLGHKSRLFSTEHIGSRVLPALKTIDAIVTEDGKFAETFREAQPDVNIEICYCSVFDQCWLTNNEDKSTVTASCNVDSNNLFLD